MIIKQTTLPRNECAEYHCIGTNGLIVFGPIHTEEGRVWTRWFLVFTTVCGNPDGVQFPPPVKEDRGAKGVGTRSLGGAPPCSTRYMCGVINFHWVLCALCVYTHLPTCTDLPYCCVNPTSYNGTSEDFYLPRMYRVPVPGTLYMYL